MKTTRVLLIGSAGRMGKTIVDLASRESNIEIVAQCDQGDALEPALKDQRPLVIGTTGHSPEQRRAVESVAKSLPIVLASNFSIGVNALFALTSRAAEILGREFTLEIIETHHRMKMDAPSGTAKTLAEILKKARESDDEISIQSIREGEVVGEHTVIFAGPGERMELTHKASGREIFARGALRAAEWIVGKPARLYTMQDVLGLSAAK
jgi:4-hydroxy-tetrahydrodipicolinate reductase